MINAGCSIGFFEAWSKPYLMAPTPGGAILGDTMPTPPRAEYALTFSSGTERRFLRCRASVRAAIRERLEGIALATAKPRQRWKRPGPNEPPLRYYVYEGYRVVYQVDDATRRVIVLDLAAVPS